MIRSFTTELLSESKVGGILSNVTERKLKVCRKPATGSSLTGYIWGINHKIDEYRIVVEILSDYAESYNTIFNPKRVLHRIHLQRLKLIAEHKRLRNWQSVKQEGLMERDKNYQGAAARQT